MAVLYTLDKEGNKKNGKFFRNICQYENNFIYSHVETFNLNIIYS